MEKRIGTLLGGYQKRSDGFAATLSDVFETITSRQIQLQSISRLHEYEQAGAASRIATHTSLIKN